MSRIEVRVTPRASRNAIEGLDAAGRLRIKVTAPPVDGAANRAVIELLSRGLEVGKKAVRLIRGETARNKIIEVHGLDPAELQKRLIRLLEDRE